MAAACEKDVTWFSKVFGDFLGACGERPEAGPGSETVAARLGVEPRQNESESFVLPLHHRAKIRSAGIARLGGAEWSRRWDSNPQPPVYKTGALPLSYAGFGLSKTAEIIKNLVAPRGLEPRTN